jgi:hypothetical protein
MNLSEREKLDLIKSCKLILQIHINDYLLPQLDKYTSHPSTENKVPLVISLLRAIRDINHIGAILEIDLDKLLSQISWIEDVDKQVFDYLTSTLAEKSQEPWNRRHK